MKTEVRARAQQWIDKLNADERQRRIVVNAEHVAKYGRLLYPEGGQYATFTFDTPGRKVTRVVMETNGQKSVHAFVDNSNGDVLMPAGWKGPARGARYNVLDSALHALLLERCEYAGGYLYANRCAA
jgi:hypothetical protein